MFLKSYEVVFSFFDIKYYIILNMYLLGLSGKFVNNFCYKSYFKYIWKKKYKKKKIIFKINYEKMVFY